MSKPTEAVPPAGSMVRSGTELGHAVCIYVFESLTLFGFTGHACLLRFISEICVPSSLFTSRFYICSESDYQDLLRNTDANQTVLDRNMFGGQRLHVCGELLGHPWVIGDCAKQDLMDAEVVTKLQRFNARRKLRAAAIASVLSSKVALRTKRLMNLLGRHDLSSEKLDNLRAHFARICADGENATLAEFEQVLRAMRLEALVPLAPRVFDLFDNNRDDTVDMREILCGLSSLRNSRGDDALRLCFQMYDADRSGCISKDELASMLRALPEECLPGDITEPGKLDEVFDEMDANGNGKVSFDEFKAAM
ncbi:Calcium and calcium/calmodulin-dependent serine/threonine-protein kinase [Zea mays]|uniref:Calcium and calcium/calmodulin-dependent serine/threonine-protein kinase n=1 Tax=Zea mays TaxID=4577 RepID=A0A3L6DUF1_MAIZE|nr:Calcium and calcium/calmodulin-dependent serine/threonine-protein kinase [Zea mays]